MTEPKKIQMVTFDLDGTIVDDEWAHEQAKVEIAKSVLGVDGDLNLSRFTGHCNRLFWQSVCDLAGKQGDLEDLTVRQFNRVMELLRERNQPESTGLTETLKYLKSAGITVALTSGSDNFFVDEILDYLKIRPYIDIKVTKDHVRFVKPDPDIYLAAQRIAGIEGAHALGVEDSIAGCTALRSAGMFSTGITHSGKNPQDLSLADFRIAQMTDLIPLIQKLNGQ